MNEFGNLGIRRVYEEKASAVTLITSSAYFYCNVKNYKSPILRGDEV